MVNGLDTKEITTQPRRVKMVTTVNDIGTKLCEAMGVDPDNVKTISFKWQAGRVAVISFGCMPTDEQADQITTVFKDYKLQEMAEDADE